MVIFHSYVKLPEGKCQGNHQNPTDSAWNMLKFIWSTLAWASRPALKCRRSHGMKTKMIKLIQANHFGPSKYPLAKALFWICLAWFHLVNVCMFVYCLYIYMCVCVFKTMGKPTKSDGWSTIFLSKTDILIHFEGYITPYFLQFSTKFSCILVRSRLPPILGLQGCHEAPPDALHMISVTSSHDLWKFNPN